MFTTYNIRTSVISYSYKYLTFMILINVIAGSAQG